MPVRSGIIDDYRTARVRQAEAEQRKMREAAAHFQRSTQPDPHAPTPVETILDYYTPKPRGKSDEERVMRVRAMLHALLDKIIS
jgi:hypothetical protein